MDGFSFKEAANYVLGFITVIIGWDVQRLNETRETLARDYVTKDDMNGIMERIDNTLIRIADKLDDKQDK